MQGAIAGRNRLRLRALVALGASLLGGAVAAAAERPNIVLIMADDLGYSDLGAYGGEIETPHIDRLASGGLSFTSFYNDAKCSETRSALLSGLYHHQTRNLALENHVTLAEVLRGAGYRTLMTGKWHVARTPTERGFDRYFGFLVGAVNYYTGREWGSDENPMRLDDAPFEVPESGFYTTDAFTDYAISFLDEASGGEQPFFLYLAYNAPHFPLHAPPEEIARFRGRYREGWDVLRERRLARMRELGLVDPAWPLTPRDGIVPAWSTLSEEQRDAEDLRMAVYAAMVHRLDSNVGRLLAHLEQLGSAENTLVLFLSDNGGCPYRFNRTPDLAPGPADSYRSYDSEWAGVSNTPFRLYKQWSHEGGIATPGSRTDQVGHIIDVMPTLLEAAGAAYPGEHEGHPVLPMEGISLLPQIRGAAAANRAPIFWEFLGNRAVRDGDFKLVAERSKPWELYDMRADRVELENLVDRYPERAAAMAERYAEWAARTGARSDEDARAMEPSTQPR